MVPGNRPLRTRAKIEIGHAGDWEMVSRDAGIRKGHDQGRRECSVICEALTRLLPLV